MTTPPQQEEWEIAYELFCKMIPPKMLRQTKEHKIKQFIRIALAKERERVIGVAEGMMSKKPHEDTHSQWECGHYAALSALIEKLK